MYLIIMSEDKSIHDFIGKALEYYFNKQENYIKSSQGIKEILGMYDKKNKVWIWGWVNPYYLSEDLVTVKELLNYGLSLEYKTNTDIHYYLKLNLVNSRIGMNKLELVIHLAIISYLLKDKSKFIGFDRTDDYNEYYIVQ